MDGASGAADGGRADLREFDGDAGFGAPKTAIPALARWLLGLGIVATLAANVAHGLGHGPIGAVVAGWPAVALVGSYELLMMVIRSSQAAFDGTSDSRITADPCRSKRLRCSPSSLRRTGLPQFVRCIAMTTHSCTDRAFRVLDVSLSCEPRHGGAPAAFSVSRPSPSARISRTPRPSSSASGKTVRSSDGVTRLAASPSQGLRPSAGWPILFLTGHRANRPRRSDAVLMLRCMRVTRESLERRGGSRHD